MTIPGSGSLLRRAALALLIPLAFQACGGDSTTTPPDDNDDGAIAITLNSSSASVAQGASTSIPATLTRSGGFTGAVNFTVTGAPTGVTAGFTSVTTTGTTTTATVTIVVAADAPAGTYNLVVKGTGTGVDDATAPFALTITATTTPNYSIALSPTSGSVVQGGNTATTATLTRTGGFVGSVNLSLTNAPTGVTAAFSANNITTNTSTVTITAAASVAPGTYTVYVGGVATGQGDKVSPFVLTVTAAGSYTLGVPSTASMVQGSGATPAITLTRTGGFTGSVALTATGMPTGMGASFTQTPTTGSTSTLTLTTTGSTVVGTYPIVVHANSAGTTEQTATISVSVTASGGGGSGNAAVSFVNCASTSKPIWFAYQNGSGAWTVVSPVNDVYSFNITASQGGYAYVTSSAADVYSTVVQYYTQGEFTGSPVGCSTLTGKTITGTGANIGTLDVTILSLGGATASPSQATPAFTLQNVANGTYDLIGFRRALLTPGVNDRAVLRRDVSLASGGSLGTVDFTGAESYAPQTATLTVPNNTGSFFHTMSYMTGASCTLGTLYSATTSTATMEGFPTAQQRASDYYMIGVTEINGTSYRGVQETFHTFGNKSITLGSSMSPATVTTLSGPYKRLQSAFTIPSDYHASMTFQYVGNSPSRAVTISSSYGALGSGSSGTVAMPDFSGLSGWNSIWAPTTGATTTSTTTVAGSTVTSTLCQEGVRITSSTTSNSAN